jgi:hypothetical protein
VKGLLLAAALVAAALTQAGVAQTGSAQPGVAQKAVRVTSPGCCTSFAWGPASDELLYLDRPPGAAATAIYSAPAGGGPARVRFSRVSFLSPDLRYAALPALSGTVLERLQGGARSTLNNTGGEPVWNGAVPGRVAYTVTAISGNYDRRSSRIYAQDFGGPARLLATLYGGGVSDWTSRTTLLVSGKPSADARSRQLFTLDTVSGARRVLNTALNFRGVSAAPGGDWVAYAVAFNPAGGNGLYVQGAASGAPRRLNFYGSYRWRDGTHLLYIPLTLNVATHVLYEYDVQTQKSRTLLDLGTTVLSDQWSVSPDGRRVAYQAAGDAAVYVRALP